MHEMTRVSQSANLGRVQSLAAQMAMRHQAPLLASYIGEGRGCVALTHEFEDGRISIDKFENAQGDCRKPTLENLLYLKARIGKLKNLWVSLGGRDIIVPREYRTRKLPINGYDFVSALVVEKFADGTLREEDLVEMAREVNRAMRQSFGNCCTKIESMGGRIEIDASESGQLSIIDVSPGNMTKREIKGIFDRTDRELIRYRDIFSPIEEAAEIVHVKIARLDPHKLTNVLADIEEKLTATARE